MHQSVRLKPPEGPGIGSDTSAADAKVLNPPGGEEDYDFIAQGIHRPAADKRVSSKPLLAAADLRMAKSFYTRLFGSNSLEMTSV